MEEKINTAVKLKEKETLVIPQIHYKTYLQEMQKSHKTLSYFYQLNFYLLHCDKDIDILGKCMEY